MGGKATIEVIEIMENISKCRVVEKKKTNPILKGDLIGNLIWAKDRKYNFCVIGDFDFDGNGSIDPDGRKRIETLITAWGGKVFNEVSVDTDFMVVGQPPVVPMKPLDDFLGGQTDEAVAYKKATERAESYNGVRADGAALGVPTFNTDRFIRFIGYDRTSH